MGGINFLEEITFKAIGYIKSRYESTDMMPKSSNESMDETAELIIDRKYLESMKSMKADEEYMLIFYFHKSDEYKQTVPFRGDGELLGLFSTHAPNRPNPIGVSTIRIKEINDNVITFYGVDMLNNTPVLDLKKIYK